MVTAAAADHTHRQLSAATRPAAVPTLVLLLRCTRAGHACVWAAAGVPPGGSGGGVWALAVGVGVGVGGGDARRSRVTAAGLGLPLGTVGR